MATAPRRMVVALLAFAAVCAAAPRNAAAEGLDRGDLLSSQPLELWSRAGSGLGALESRCERAARAGWRLEETIDPWAMPLAPCKGPPRFEPRATQEIVYPWPAERSDAWAASHEIVDPWAAARR